MGRGPVAGTTTWLPWNLRAVALTHVPEAGATVTPKGSTAGMHPRGAELRGPFASRPWAPGPWGGNGRAAQAGPA